MRASNRHWYVFLRISRGVLQCASKLIIVNCCLLSYPTSTRRHGNFAGVHTLLRIILSSNSAVLIYLLLLHLILTLLRRRTADPSAAGVLKLGVNANSRKIVGKQPFSSFS
jgi:hypothetical protein